jgi:hypothetical protein
MAAIQIGITNPKYSLPLENQAQETKVEETFINKPFLVETTITKDEPKVVHKVSYTPANNDNVEKLYEDSTNNCVEWAKAQTGIYGTFGWGARAGINSYTPQIGAIGAERSLVHAFVVESIQENGVMAIESNYKVNWITRRFIPFSDILGYIY